MPHSREPENRNQHLLNGRERPARLQRALQERHFRAATQARLRELGANPIGSAPEELDRFWKEQLALYEQIAQKANVKLTMQ